MANGEAYYVTSERQYLCDKGNMARRQWHRLFNFFFKNRLLGMKDNFRAYFLILVLPSYLLSDCYCDLKASHKCDFDSGDRRRLLQLLRQVLLFWRWELHGYFALFEDWFSSFFAVAFFSNFWYTKCRKYYCSQKLKHIVRLPFATIAYGTAAMLLVKVWDPDISILSISTLLRIIMLAEVVCDASFMTLYWYQDGGRLSDQLMALLQYQQENIHFLSEEILGLQESLSK
ncbi:uncharacterized protein LOC124885635 isoform X4 [Capsicum annuum]|uniref:uncharacterized protein LOC124885635 isoform X4 n=1 Tax=Capsicum annuum TaxID=4072 RepID=UPI001FB0F114|nr:uncharacterized protein LOC124885635 isoform X4 [Capsicum annuum]